MKNNNIDNPQIDVTKCPHYSNSFGRDECFVNDIGCMDKIQSCQKEYCLWYSQQQVMQLNSKIRKIKKIIGE